jgi:hypothetical protein
MTDQTNDRTDLVTVTRPIPSSGKVVLRVAQTVQLRDVVAVAPLPGPVRGLAARVLRRFWDRGMFAILMALGFSVRETVPLRRLTLARPLGRARTSGWSSGAPRQAVLVGLTIAARGSATEVSVSVGVDPSRRLRARVVRLVVRLLGPVLAWGLGLWLAGLEARIAAPRA